MQLALVVTLAAATWGVALSQPPLKGQIASVLEGFAVESQQNVVGPDKPFPYETWRFVREADQTTIDLALEGNPPLTYMLPIWEATTLSNALERNTNPFPLSLGEKCLLTSGEWGANLSVLRLYTIVTIDLRYRSRKAIPKPALPKRLRDLGRLEGLARLELAKLDDKNVPADEKSSLTVWAKTKGYQVKIERPSFTFTFSKGGHTVVVAPGCYEMLVDGTKKSKLIDSVILHDDTFQVTNLLGAAILKATK